MGMKHLKKTINNDLNAPHQMALPMNKIRINEVKNVLNTKSIEKRLRATEPPKKVSEQ